MAADFETIKDYLVGIGFSVNQQQLKKFTGVLEDIGKKVEVKSASMGSKFAKAGGVMVATITSIVGATALLMDKVAKSDMGYQLYGMRMYTNTEVAKKMKIAIDALGYSMEEIAFNPELNKRFGTLIADQIRLQKGLPANFKQSMTDIREIDFQFTRLKVKLMWFMDGLAGKLAKSLGLEGWDEPLKKLNDWFEQKMPGWQNNIVGFIKNIKEKWENLSASFDSNEVTEQFRKMRTAFKELKEDWDSIDGTSLAWQGFKNEIMGVALAFAGVGRTLAQTADVYVKLTAHNYKGAIAAGLKIFDFSDALPRGAKEWQSFFRGEKGLDFSKMTGILPDLWNSFGKLKTDEQAPLEETRDKAKMFSGKYDAIINKASKLYNIDSNLIRKIIATESSFNMNAISRVGAMGLMQLMPDTAKEMGVKNAYDPEQNIMGGTKYFKKLLDRYNGNTSFALAAYNWGSRNVDLEKNFSKMPRETQDYVNKILPNTINVGDITVNVAGTSATPKEISNKLIAGIQKKMSINTLLRQYEVAGVYR